MFTREQFVNEEEGLRDRFEDYLVDECWYSTYVAEESDDWWNDRVDEEYEIYCQWFTNEHKREHHLQEREEASEQEEEANKAFRDAIASIK